MLKFLKRKMGTSLMNIVSSDEMKLRSDTLRNLVNAESKIGSEILGVPMHGGRREFFLSPTHSNEWLWHEETPDGSKSLTVRYIISKEEGVIKSRNGAAYELVTGAEFNNLKSAIKSYHNRVMNELYSSRAKLSV